MSVDNRTPFPALAFRNLNLAGEMLGVVVVRGTFQLSNGGPLRVADKQFPLVMSDTYEGDPHQTPQVACTDLAPFKPGTDVTFLGASFAPGKEPLRSWTCGLRVGPVEKQLRVYGARVWRPRTKKTWMGLVDRSKEDVLAGWDLSEAEPVLHVPIDWRLAFGGPLAQGRAHDGTSSHPLNPIGCGIADADRFPDVNEWPAPQIEAVGQSITTPCEEIEPAGLGPVSPFWQQRCALAGTYDDAWLEKRHPLLPRDFSFRFWQAAPKGMVAEPWLEGDETYALTNLVPGYPVLEGRLPGLRLWVEIDQGTGPARGEMVLDGVHFDMRPGVGRVFLTWRTAFPWPERKGLPLLQWSRQREAV